MVVLFTFSTIISIERDYFISKFDTVAVFEASVNSPHSSGTIAETRTFPHSGESNSS